MYTIKGKLLLVLFCMGLFAMWASAQTGEVPIDTLLNRADVLHPTDPLTAVATAQKAYNAAVKTNQSAKQAKALNLLAYFAYVDKNPSKGEAYALSAIKMAKQAQVDSLTGDALSTLGSIQSGSAQFQKAILAFQEALTFYRHWGNNGRIATAYLNIGVCQRKLGRFEQAGSFYIKAAEIYQQLGDEPSLADAYNAIGNCFTSAGSYQKGIIYHHKALSIREGLKDNDGIAQSCSNLGYVLRLARQPDPAIKYLLRALAIRRNNPDSSRLVLTLQNIGAAWKMKNNLPLAKAYISRSLIIAKAYNMQEEEARGKLDFGEVLIAQHQASAAQPYAAQAVAIAQQLHIPELLMNAYALQIKVYEQKKDYKSAFEFTNLQNNIKDSLITAAKDKTINELEATYQFKQKQRDIAALTQKNKLEREVNTKQHQFIIVMAITAFLLVLLLAILLAVYRQKVKAGQHIQTLMQELHHRVKNNLQILSGLFIMQIDNLSDETAKAALRENESRLTSMNLIHHKLYQDRSTTSIGMQEYLENLISHIKHSFGGPQTAHIAIKAEITPLHLDADKAVAVGLIVNELMTNAIKHAFKERPGTISLSLRANTAQTAILLLSDDGPGWHHAATQSESPSFGLKIVNLMARQLDAKLETSHDGHTSYRMVIKI